jgi:hypothetical protein
VAYAIAASDLNSDGTPDIVLGYTAGPHAVFFNDGTGRQFPRIMFGDAKASRAASDFRLEGYGATPARQIRSV